MLMFSSATAFAFRSAILELILSCSFDDFPETLKSLKKKLFL